jgi:hypothetical protein
MKNKPGVNNDDLYSEDDILDNGDEDTSTDENQDLTNEGDSEDEAGSTQDTNNDDGDEAPRKSGGHKGLNKRINELTKKRREAERERDAERAKAIELERRLKEVESFQSDAEISSIDSRMEAMKQRLMAARAADDIDEEVKIQQDIAAATQQKMVHMARKSVNESERKQLENNKSVQAPPRRVLPEVESIIEANPWMFAPATPEQQQAAFIARRLANQLESEGLDPYTDPEYAEQMETLLGEELAKRGLDVLQYTYNSQNRSSAAPKGNQSQANPAKAGSAQRGGLSSSSSVKSAKGPSFKLSAAQKELAKLAGMSEAKYAEYMSANKD